MNKLQSFILSVFLTGFLSSCATQKQYIPRDIPPAPSFSGIQKHNDSLRALNGDDASDIAAIKSALPANTPSPVVAQLDNLASNNIAEGNIITAQATEIMKVEVVSSNAMADDTQTHGALSNAVTDDARTHEQLAAEKKKAEADSKVVSGVVILMSLLLVGGVLLHKPSGCNTNLAGVITSIPNFYFIPVGWIVLIVATSAIFAAASLFFAWIIHLLGAPFPAIF